MAKLQVAEIGKYQRIESLNTAIKMLEETLYPTNMIEAKEVMIKSLEDRIDDIVAEMIKSLEDRIDDIVADRM